MNSWNWDKLENMYHVLDYCIFSVIKHKGHNTVYTVVHVTSNGKISGVWRTWIIDGMNGMIKLYQFIPSIEKLKAVFVFSRTRQVSK